jgi:hypothetical protein
MPPTLHLQEEVGHYAGGAGFSIHNSPQDLRYQPGIQRHSSLETAISSISVNVDVSRSSGDSDYQPPSRGGDDGGSNGDMEYNDDKVEDPPYVPEPPRDEPPAKRRRGRPRKQVAPNHVSANVEIHQSPSSRTLQDQSQTVEIPNLRKSEGQSREEAIRAEQNRSASLATKRQRLKATVDKISPRERSIHRIRLSIAYRIQCSLTPPDILNAKKLHDAEVKRTRKRRRRKKDGDDETVASDGHAPDDEDGPLNKSRKVPDIPSYVETMPERDLRIDLTREAMALELGTFAKFGYSKIIKISNYF